MNDEILEIDAQIFELQKKKATILAKLKRNATTLKEKLQIWNSSENKKNLGDLAVCQQYPLLYKYIKNGDWQRYRTLDIGDLFEEELYYFLDATEEEYAANILDEKFLLLLEEIADNNIGSVTIDW